MSGGGTGSRSVLLTVESGVDPCDDNEGAAWGPAEFTSENGDAATASVDVDDGPSVAASVAASGAASGFAMAFGTSKAMP